MFGFIINTISVIVCSLIGLFFNKRIKKEHCDEVIKVEGLGCIVIGILGVIESSVVIDDGAVSTKYSLLLIVSLALGTYLGSLLRIENRLENLSLKIEKKLNKGKIAEGFLTATLLYCIGAMTIIGSLNDTLGKPEMIYLKSILDGVSSIILASTLGIGVLLSGVSVFVVQGLITLLFFFVGKAIDLNTITELLKMITIVGYTIVIAIGINFLRKEKLKIANMLPSLLIPIIYYLIRLIIK